MSCGLFYLNSLNWTMSNRRNVCFFVFLFFCCFFLGGGGGGGRGGVTLTFLEILYLIQTVQTLMRFSGVWSEYTLFVYIGIKHGFSCINILQVPWEVLKTAAGGRGFQHLPRHLANVNALKKHVRSLLLHKNWKHLLHFALFLALFCFAFSSMSHERDFHGLSSF